MMEEIVARTAWWSIHLCPYCNYEYREYQTSNQVNCSSCGKISENKILAPYYIAAKRKVWTAKYPWWQFWKKDEYHYEYHGRRDLPINISP